MCDRERKKSTFERVEKSDIQVEMLREMGQTQKERWELQGFLWLFCRNKNDKIDLVKECNAMGVEKNHG